MGSQYEVTNTQGVYSKLHKLLQTLVWTTAVKKMLITLVRSDIARYFSNWVLFSLASGS